MEYAYQVLMAEHARRIAERSPEATKIAEVTSYYVDNLNLRAELNTLPNSTVIDGGCGYGAGTQGLQLLFPQHKLVGIDSELFDTIPNADPITVPILQGRIEELSAVVNQLDPEVYSPRAILLRNSMQFLHIREMQGMTGLIRSALGGFGEVLPSGGKVLIYDADLGDESYKAYMAEITRGSLGFIAEVLKAINPIGSPNYLKLSRI